MPRPGSGGGKTTISGSRTRDVVQIDVLRDGQWGYLINDQFKPLSEAQLAAGVIVNANAGDDRVVGGRGPDELNGGDGNDVLIGSSGLDRLNGGAGDDTLIDLDMLLVDDDTSDGIDPNANLGAFFDGGRGIDTISFMDATKGVSVHLSGGYIDTDVRVVHDGHRLIYGFDSTSALQRVANVENIVGSAYNDFLAGDNSSNVISGGAGDDAIWGVGISTNGDRLYGDAGFDELLGGAGNDFMAGGSEGDTFLFSGLANGGTDVIADYNQAEGDRIVFMYESGAPSWSTVDHDGDGDLAIRLVYSNGAVIVDNVSDISLLNIVTSPNDIW